MQSHNTTHEESYKTGARSGKSLKKRFKPDIFLLVLIGDSHISAIGYQVKGSDLSKLLLVNRESHVQNVGNIVVSEE